MHIYARWTNDPGVHIIQMTVINEQCLHCYTSNEQKCNKSMWLTH